MCVPVVLIEFLVPDPVGSNDLPHSAVHEEFTDAVNCSKLASGDHNENFTEQK